MQAVSVASQTSSAGGGKGGGIEGGDVGGGGAGGGGTICGVQTSPPLSCIHVQPSLQSFLALGTL